MALFRSFLAGGLGGFAEDSFSIQIIVGIWIYASIAEEVLTRGLVQGYLKPLAEKGLTISDARISVPVFVGALFFALMHIAMVTLGVDIVSVAATVISAICSFGLILLPLLKSSLKRSLKSDVPRFYSS